MNLIIEFCISIYGACGIYIGIVRIIHYFLDKKIKY